MNILAFFNLLSIQRACSVCSKKNLFTQTHAMTDPQGDKQEKMSYQSCF